jgi:hypothetical protein
VRGPTERAPLILIINEDMVALREFRQALTKRDTERRAAHAIGRLAA